MAIAQDKSSQSVTVSTIAKKKQWRDLDLSLYKHPITKDIVPLKDDKAIKNALKNLILTNFYERPFNHTTAANLSGLLFEPADTITKIEMREAIRRVVEFHESRVKYLGTQISDDQVSNSWKVSIFFIIKHTNEQQNVNLVLRRLR